MVTTSFYIHKICILPTKCFVWISEQTAIISLYSINWQVYITETEWVYCAVRTGCLTVIHVTLSLWKAATGYSLYLPSFYADLALLFQCISGSKRSRGSSVQSVQLRVTRAEPNLTACTYATFPCNATNTRGVSVRMWGGELHPRMQRPRSNRHSEGAAICHATALNVAKQWIVARYTRHAKFGRNQPILDVTCYIAEAEGRGRNIYNPLHWIVGPLGPETSQPHCPFSQLWRATQAQAVTLTAQQNYRTIRAPFLLYISSPNIFRSDHNYRATL